MITKRGSGFPDAIETVDKETSDTYTVSYTTAVLALALLAKQLGADDIDDAVLGRVPEEVAAAIADRRSTRSPAGTAAQAVGAGPSAVTAQECALKVQEASRASSRRLRRGVPSAARRCPRRP
jgi:glucosamine--fructose-6-phosphate aminotransferase (isomerizing)